MPSLIKSIVLILLILSASSSATYAVNLVSSGAINAQIPLVLAATVPPPPTLISPSNGATGVSVTPTLSWSSVSGAASYIAQVWSSSDCVHGSGTVINQWGWTSTSYTVPTGTLSAGTCYLWWVYSQNSAGEYGDHSALWVFTTAGSGGTPQISVSPTTVTQGGSVTVTGTGFSASVTVTLYLGVGGGGAFVFNPPSSSSGTWTYSMGIGTNVPTGQRDVRAVDPAKGSSNTVYITVNPAGPTGYTLSVSAGTGGTVSGTVSGSYAAGTSISVTATPSSSSYTFSSWSVSGASCSGGSSANPCSFSMPSNAVTLTANFASSTQYYVCTYVTPNNIGGTFTISGVGTVGDGGRVAVAIGTVYPISPTTVPSNYKFSSWSPQRSVTVASQTSASTTVTFGSSGWDGYCVGSLVLNLVSSVPSTYSFSVSAGSGGTVSGTPSGSYAAGTAISVTESPSSGYGFSGWTISGTSCAGGTTSNPCAFSMPTNAVSLTASFVSSSTPTISVSPTTVTQGNSVVVSGTGFSASVTVTLYLGIGGGGAFSFNPASSASGTWTYTMLIGTNVPTGQRDVRAVDPSKGSSNTVYITVNPPSGGTYPLTVSAGAGGSVSGTASGSYATSTVISVTAVASSGYSFSSWSVSGASCSSGTSVSPCSFSMPSNAVSMTANFVPVVPTKYSFTVSAGSGGTVSGTASGSYAAGTSVSVIATPSSGYSFSSWSISGASCSGGSSASPCAFSMPSNAVTVTANFVGIPTESRYVCTYVVPDYAGAGIVIGGVGTYYGQGYERAPITADGRTYALSVSLPSGVTFVRWGTQRSVSVANLNSASTTVSFTESGWDGECVGALQLYVQVPPVAGCETLPLKIYDSGKWEWWIQDAGACSLYLQHKSEVDFFKPYPDAVTTWLSNNLGQMENFPAKAQLYLTPPGGALQASGTSISIPIDAFYGSRDGVLGGWAYVLIAHETMNLYTGEAVSSGWPCDWWADGAVGHCGGIGKSPFPLVTGMKAGIDLNWQQSKTICQIHLNNHAQIDPLVAMLQVLYNGYGNGMFSRTFAAMKSDGMNLEDIGENPSALRTNYVTAYLTIGAGGDLASVFTGKVPNFDPIVTMNIKQARTNLQSIPRLDSRWTEYLRGNYAPALQGGTTIVANFAYKSAGQPSWISIQQGASIKVVSPVQFQVQITQGQVYAVRIMADGTAYAMTPSSNIYTTSLNLSSDASHVIRFEYQSSSGGSWGPLGLLDTQSQETGLAGMFSALVALVLNNWLVSSGLMLVLLVSTIVIVWRRQH